jgi:hypothetical protein
LKLPLMSVGILSMIVFLLFNDEEQLINMIATIIGRKTLIHLFRGYS